MNNLPTYTGLEDEEDLEALRLAALQSLKKSAPLLEKNNQQIYLNKTPEQPGQFWQGNKAYRNKKGKHFGNQYVGRGNRNFQANFNRARTTNLISIQTLPDESEEGEKISTNNPQARLYTKDDDGDKSQDSSSKFDRYNNSDNSESDSEKEDDILLSDEEDSPKLKKSDSLEALMQELDKEIQGKPIDEEKIKNRKTKKRKKSIESKTTTVKDGEENSTENEKKCEEKPSEESQVPADAKDTVTSSEVTIQSPETRDTVPKRIRTGSPPNRRNFYNRRRQRNFHHPQQPINPHMMPYGSGPGPVPYPPQMLPYNGQTFNPMFGPPHPLPNQAMPPFFDNPLPPLAINTDPLSAPTMAPLSPRSAAFVMENKAIIERRRRSPRRSYSRSPSRSPVRSLSPRRSPRWSVSPRRSPLRRLPPRKRSLTPKRKSISPRRKSLSPRRKSISPRRSPPSSRRKSLSPKRKSISPRRRSISPRKRSLSPKRRSVSPRRRSMSPRSPRKRSTSPRKRIGDSSVSKAPVRDRLGMKSKTDDKEKTTKPVDESPKKDDKPLDPILEARKRKFETKELNIKGGIIRLKPKEDKPKDEKPVEVKPTIQSEKTRLETKPEKVPTKREKESTATEEKQESKEIRSTTPKPKENVVEVAPATTTTTDDSVPDEFKELEKLLAASDEIDLDNPKVEDIFSDEDSASDNEGRFKVKRQKSEDVKPAVISFTKLVNGEKRDIKPEPLTNSYSRTKDSRQRSGRDRPVPRQRSGRESPAPRQRSGRNSPVPRNRSPVVERKEKKDPMTGGTQQIEKKKPIEKLTPTKSLSKQRISFRTERPPPPVMDKRFERKIEIKIKNPSKYERSGKSKVVEVGSASSGNVERKMKIEERGDSSEDDDGEIEDDDEEPEFIIDNESDDEPSNFNEGDLRAQLSKKRAEKLHKIPVEQVSSRLLKYALKGAVFKKSKKKSKDKDISSSDGKPPIHFRLGLGNALELYSESKPKRKSRKRKNREVLEQLE